MHRLRPPPPGPRRPRPAWGGGQRGRTRRGRRSPGSGARSPRRGEGLRVKGRRARRAARGGGHPVPGRAPLAARLRSPPGDAPATPGAARCARANVRAQAKGRAAARANAATRLCAGARDCRPRDRDRRWRAGASSLSSCRVGPEPGKARRLRVSWPADAHGALTVGSEPCGVRTPAPACTAGVDAALTTGASARSGEECAFALLL